jgi:hypothetical protein
MPLARFADRTEMCSFGDSREQRREFKLIPTTETPE